MQFQADVTSDLDEIVKSILNRLKNAENENGVLGQQNANLNDRLTQESDRLSKEKADLNDRLTQKIDALERENNRLKLEVQSLKDAQAQGSVVQSNKRNMTSPVQRPETHSQYMAFACTNDIVTLSCSTGRTILAVSANYGQYEFSCTGCCAPNPLYDCTELVEENQPSDWLAIQALCNGQESCQFVNPGWNIDQCDASYTSEYMQLFYDCLPDDETGPVAFTAWANTGSPTSYNYGEIIVFNEVLANAGGHYNLETNSFVCPWHGVYQVSVNIQGYNTEFMAISPMRNDVIIGDIWIDDISGVCNRGSTTIVTECDRGDILWVSAEYTGAIHTNSFPITLFTVHMIQRY